MKKQTAILFENEITYDQHHLIISTAERELLETVLAIKEIRLKYPQSINLLNKVKTAIYSNQHIDFSNYVK